MTIERAQGSRRSLRDLLDDRYGVATEVRVSADGSEVGTTTAELLREDPKRLSFIIVNLSANIIYVSPRRSVSSEQGIRLAPNGGNLTLDYSRDFDLVGFAWHAVASVANSDVFTLEVRAR